jgi:caffeoyl-CoA O-methyltransferase
MTTARSRSRFIDPGIADYALDHSSPPDAVQLELQRVTAERTGNAAGMQIGDDQAVLLEILARATGARRAVEIGTFTGYSSLALARGIGPDGRLLCCDVSEEWTNVARRAWTDAGVDGKIELVLAPAADTLRALPDEEYVDLAFIDADKPSYPVYYEELLRRLRPNGLILVDNTLWSGAVVDPAADDESTVAMRAFNDMVAADARVESALLTLGDGLTILRKR